MKSNHKGFSLIEVLAATVILGVLITAVLGPLAQLFRNTGRSDQTLRTTTQIQELVEYVRGQWQSYPEVMITDPTNPKNRVNQNLAKTTDSQNRYDRTCFSLPTITNMTSVVTVQTLDRNATVTGTLSYSTCPSPLTPPTSLAIVPIKRINVTLTATNGSKSNLTLDIPRPR